MHPAIINLYENKGLEKYTDELNRIEADDDKTGLTVEEKIVMKILGSN